MMIKLQPGDYVATADIKDEAEYHAIAKAFIEAGAASDYAEGMSEVWETWESVGWDDNGFFIAADYPLKRQLTPAQILATPQWVPEVGEVCRIQEFTEMGQWVELKYDYRIEYIGERVVVAKTVDSPRIVERVFENMVKFIPLPTEEDRAVEEMADCIDGFEGISMKQSTAQDLAAYLLSNGYRKPPQPAVDMSDPANWRAGDILMALEHGSDISKEGEYEIVGFDSEGDPIIKDDVDDTQANFAREFCFVRRP